MIDLQVIRNDVLVNLHSSRPDLMARLSKPGLGAVLIFATVPAKNGWLHPAYSPNLWQPTAVRCTLLLIVDSRHGGDRRRVAGQLAFPTVQSPFWKIHFFIL